MESALLWLAVATLSLYAAAGFDLWRGSLSIPFLRTVPPKGGEPHPRVSIVVAARNEQRRVLRGVGSLLRLDYPDLEVIAIDDRSEDATGRLLEEMAAAEPRLRVIHLRSLPPRWLGKNHALWVGSRMASGELLLFTDADVEMERSLLRRAVSLMKERELDHLTVTPEARMPSTFLEMFGTTFILFFSLFTRPWKARSPKSRCHIGIGAFNLVSASAYRSVGGHERIRLRPDDDLKLGKLLKRGGMRQDVAYGTGLMQVEWYASLGELIRGLEKNAFAGADYRVALVLWGCLFHLLCTVWPFLAVLVLEGPARWIYLAVVLLLVALFVHGASLHGSKSWHVIGFPAAALLFVFIMLRTMLLNLSQGGLRWRGTFYPLNELKENRV